LTPRFFFYCHSLVLFSLLKIYSILTAFLFIRTHEKQLRLFDIRLKRTELHAFGWKQESSDSQSALINQAWSPDGLYITSGSTDPVIHIFDIRYNVNRPSQSIRAHQKRVFRALWLQSLPLLISISSDLNIGLHTLQK
jgi:WD40 repeat protein